MLARQKMTKTPITTRVGFLNCSPNSLISIVITFSGSIPA